MARRKIVTSLRSFSEINMTSMMDLSFLLLITFIITYPLMEQGIPINLPRANAERLKDDTQKTHTISVNEKGLVFLESTSITLEKLEIKMKDLGKSDPKAVVLVRADEKARYGSVVKVLRILHDAKIAKMSLVTSPEGKKRTKK